MAWSRAKRPFSLRSEKGRFALLHAIAHIELNAIDLAWDIVARFAGSRIPRSFYDGWVRVAFENHIEDNVSVGRLDKGCGQGAGLQGEAGARGVPPAVPQVQYAPSKWQRGHSGHSQA